MGIMRFESDGCPHCTPKDKEFEFDVSSDEFKSIPAAENLDSDSNYDNLHYDVNLQLHLTEGYSEGEPSGDYQLCIQYTHEWNERFDIRISGSANYADEIEVPVSTHDDLWIPVNYCPWCGRDLRETTITQENNEKLGICEWDIHH